MEVKPLSYSQDLKNELCRRTPHCGSCPEALLYGMLLFSRAAREALFVSENRRAAALFAQTAAELTGAIVTVRDPETASRRPAYTVWLEDDSCQEELLGRFLLEGERDSIRPELLRRECCAMSFLRGAYLACGTMSDPQGEYHLEFGVPDTSLGEELLEVLELYELDFRQSSRGRNPIVYTKESNQIEDFLARIGAPKAAMELMNLKIEKELRNKVNRVTNCETANISKTVNASMEQIRRIRSLQESGELERLPAPLREAALLRLENPDASLRELCELAGGTVSRSGLNHRLRRVMELAGEQE